MKKLVGNLDMKKSGPDWNNVEEMCEILDKFQISQISKSEIEEIICILDSNSYQLVHENLILRSSPFENFIL